MLNRLITKNRIQVVDSLPSWMDAVEQVCKPLVDDGAISLDYQSAIVDSTNELGPYYVLAPGIAMPHARPENGVNKNALALLVVREGVEFNSEENDPVKLLLLLAAKDSDQHIELITSISEFFCNEQDVSDVINAINIDEIIKIITKY